MSVFLTLLLSVFEHEVSQCACKKVNVELSAHGYSTQMSLFLKLTENH